MAKKIFILGVNGGRAGGRIGTFLKRALRKAKFLGAKTKLIELARLKLLTMSRVSKNPEFDNTLDHSPDDMAGLYKDILLADGIIFATPVHWFGPSSEMKIFIDRLTPLENAGFLLEGKVAGFLAYGNEAGKMNTLMQMAATASHMGMVVPPYGLVYFGQKRSLWASRDPLLLAQNMLNLIRAIKENQVSFDYK